MKAKQRVLVVILVLGVLLGQGVRWSMGQDDKQLILPVEAAASAMEHASLDRHCDLVHVNTAGIAELQTLPGIGVVYAERIIMSRREQPFHEPEDLLRVSGIGPKRLEGLIDLVCFYLPGGE